MVDLTKLIEITASGYLPQFRGGTVRHSKYYNTQFYTTTVHLKDIYLIKYASKEYNSTLDPFKARCYK